MGTNEWKMCIGGYPITVSKDTHGMWLFKCDNPEEYSQVWAVLNAKANSTSISCSYDGMPSDDKHAHGFGKEWMDEDTEQALTDKMLDIYFGRDKWGFVHEENEENGY